MSQQVASLIDIYQSILAVYLSLFVLWLDSAPNSLLPVRKLVSPVSCVLFFESWLIKLTTKEFTVALLRVLALI